MNRLPGRGRRFVALDWDAQTLKAVEVAVSAAGLKVQRVISAHIPGDVKCGEAESFGTFIRGVLHEKRFSTHQALMAVPRDRAVLLNLRMPQGPVGDLSSMVRLQASRELPFPADEAVLDFAGSTAHDAPEFLDLTVAAIQKEAMGFYKDLAGAAGLSLARLGLRPNSSLVSVTRGVQPFGDDRILLVDIGAGTTEINIFRWGRLTFSRAVSVDADPAVDSEGMGRRVFQEVLRTVEAYRASDPTKMDQIIIAGDTGLETKLAELLRGRFDAPASIYDPTWTVAIDKERAEQMTGFCAVLGLVAGQVCPELGRFDFANPKRPADVKAIRRKQITLGGGLAAAILLATVAIGGTYIGNLRAEGKALGDQVADLKKRVDGFKQISKRIESTRKWMDQEIVWVDVLHELAEQMPENKTGYATKLQAKGQNRQIDLGIRAAGMTESNELCDRLAEVDGVTPEIRNTQESTGKYPYVSDITIRIAPPAKVGAPKTNAKTPVASQSASATRQTAPRP